MFLARFSGVMLKQMREGEMKDNTKRVVSKWFHQFVGSRLRAELPQADDALIEKLTQPASETQSLARTQANRPLPLGGTAVAARSR